MKARAVHRDLLREVQTEGWVDVSRGPWIEGEIAWVPVRDGEAFDLEIPERHRYSGRGFYMIGDIAVVHGKRPGRSDIEGIAGFRHPRGILWIESLRSVTRTPATEVLWGEVGEVEHRESGYRYLLDPRRVMFSQGNRVEKERIAGLVRESGREERIADMFAGIGYFAIPMAGSGGRVHAMEINTVAFDYLVENIRRNRLEDSITASAGDCRCLLAGTYDRIVMGHFDAVDFLPSVFPHTAAGSVIHLHSIGPVEDRISTAADEAGFSVSVRVHKVKKYRPHAWHVVQDVTLS
ncbi:MAG TPA: SAM-dependent methyltransferase [Methanoregula sp.]|nr:SAM-dependent methyltransferase [Methanoregula sp.]